MLCNATELVCVYKSRVSTSIIISNSSLLSRNHFTFSRMKQVAAVVLFFAAVQLVACQREINKDYCAINHAANVAKLEYIASDLKSLVSSLRQEMDCEKPGQPLNPVESCKDVPRFKGSGEYFIQPKCSNDGPFKVYCDMDSEERFPDTQGGWMKVANLDMTDLNQTCPDGFAPITRNTKPKRLCGRPSTVSAGCVSVVFPVHGAGYSQVCGRVKAYQYASPDAFYRSQYVHLDSNYLDGVSITHGKEPRSHVWSFTSSWSNNHPLVGCPCSSGDGSAPPSFVGQDYFCESGHRNTWVGALYPDNPLWDGVGCLDSSTCCDSPRLPWFCTTLSSATTNDIEVRLCADQGINDEDVPIEQVEIFVN